MELLTNGKATMFIGEYHHNIDEKGRLQVPTKWRSSLEGGAVVTKGFDGSLKCYPLAAWSETAEKLSKLPQSQPEIRAYVRQTLAGAVDEELDKLGRLNLPGLLRQFAGMKKETVLAGLHDHFEIWEAGAWDAYLAGLDADNIQIQLQAIGI